MTLSLGGRMFTESVGKKNVEKILNLLLRVLHIAVVKLLKHEIGQE